MILRIFGLICFTFLSLSLFAQNEVVIGSPEYQKLKSEGNLDGYILRLEESSFTPKAGAKYKPSPTSGDPKSSICDCYVAPDASYTLALAPNDDGSSSVINIPFTFNFYGQNYTSFYINNNGNITFGGGLYNYSSNAFPSSPDKIIAPFWGDVDTRGGNGQVVYKITPTAVYINWEQVGYYNTMGDKLNTFQLILSDGSDPAIPDGNNVAFCYQDMQWTTGAASSGVNGFGGIPATCGANKGDNVAYFLIARFDHAGNDFDGALGNPDGISWLDYKSFFFDVTNSGNVPPIPEGVAACDTFKVCSFGDTADISLRFFAPEANQLTSITYTNGGLTSLQEIANIPGNTAELILRIVGTPVNAGTYTITVTAVDDFVPAGITTMNFVIVIEDGTGFIDPVLDYTVACDTYPVGVLNGPYDTYLWDDYSTQQTSTVSNSGYYGVTVSLNNCYKRVDADFYVPSAATFGLEGNLYLCPGEDSTLIVIGDSLGIDVMNWNLPNPSLNNLFQNWLSPGTYTITNMDSTGLCSNDTTFTIGQSSASVIFGDTVSCTNLTFQVVGATAGTGSVWSSPNPAISFSNTGVSNPLITATAYGVYTVNLTNPCVGNLTAQITFPAPPVIFNDTVICDLKFNIPLSQVSTFGPSTWSANPGGVFTSSSAQTATQFEGMSAGVYQLTLTDNTCPNKSTVANVELKIPPTVTIPSLACDLTTFDLNSTYPAGGGITWTFIDNPSTAILEDTSVTYFGSTNANSQNPFVRVDEAGTYTVNYVITGDCPLTGSGNIYFAPYLWTEIKDTMLCLGVEYPMDAAPNSSANVTYTWNDGTVGLTHMITQPGTYSVTISNQCPTHDYTSTAVVGYYMCDIEAPNVISLSSTSGNNMWFVNSTGIAEFECFITNRWGNLIYEFNNVHGAWDGRTKSGNFVEEGVYFYHIKAKAYGGEEVIKQGFITVVH